jgi:hypothetical protein
VPVTLYRIKLYGHSGGDTELFCKNLATILDIDPERARSLLQDSPAVIKEGIEKQKAEEFCKLLEPIRALCIVEPINGEVSEEVPIAAVSSPRLADISEADDVEKESPRGSRIWMVALAAAVGFLLLFIGGGFLSSFLSLYRHNRPPATAPQGAGGSADTKAELQSTEAGPASFEELQTEIDTLEARIESNRFRLAEAEEARGKLHGSARTQNRDLEESALNIRDLKDRIRSDTSQLQILKRRMEEIEMGGE